MTPCLAHACIYGQYLRVLRASARFGGTTIEVVKTDSPGNGMTHSLWLVTHRLASPGVRSCGFVQAGARAHARAPPLSHGPNSPS